MTSALTRVTEDSYLEELRAQDIDVVRAKRQECQDIENALSYVRRLLHGRLDIVRSELERRRAGDAPADLDTIVARLPSLLAEGSRSDALPRPPQDLTPGGYAESLVAELDERFPASVMADIPKMGLPDLAALGDALAQHESEVSSGRTSLHEVIDQLHEEIIRRYQDGDASVDSLLR